VRPLTVREAAVADFRDSPWRLRLTLVAVAFWIAYEWGIGNETVTPWILVQVIAANPGWSAIPATAAVGFAFTATQQLVSGVTALAGFSIFDRTARAAWTSLRQRFETVPGEWSTLGWSGRSIVVFTLGTTAVALVQVMATGEVGVRRHLRAIVQSAVLCGVLVGCFGGLAAALAAAGRRSEALAGPTDWVLRVLGNPLFWLGILIVAGMIALVRTKTNTQEHVPRHR